ncbi:MAG: hypothetical protein KGN76_12080 [Acidobacteriota bacterium]|nr:hypothetical protein [Acidobacteriota bacterium]
MRHRSVRIGLAITALMASLAAGWYVAQAGLQVRRVQAAARAFEAGAQNVAMLSGAVKAGQRAYIAPGQGQDFWTQYVARSLADIDTGLATLQRTATSAGTEASLKSAATFAAQLADLDGRVRKALKIGDVLMASDTIFSEGEQAAANLARQVDAAGTQERAASDQVESSAGRRQAAAAAAAVLVDLTILGLFVFGDRPRPAALPVEEPRLTLATGTGSGQPAAAGTDEFAHLRFDGAEPAATTAGPPPGPDLDAAAALCAEIARLDSSSGLPMLLERVATLLDASGVVLWAGMEGGTELRPALSHGYAPQVVAKMTAIPRDANNVTAAAYRAEQVQIATGDTVGNGVIAVPLLSPEGCAGVLTAEMRRGGETNPAMRALASIFASQFGAVLGTAPSSAASANVAQSGGR